MIKKVQSQFSIEAWKNGKQVETRNGRQVRILCTDSKCNEGSIVGLVADSDNGHLYIWHDTGRYWSTDKTDDRDLVIVEEIEISEQWSEDKNAIGVGWYIDLLSNIDNRNFALNQEQNYFAFAARRQAKSALAMARLSQIIAHDKRFGGMITEKEWENDSITKYIIERYRNDVRTNLAFCVYRFLAFHTQEQCNLFAKENQQWIKDYFMVD